MCFFCREQILQEKQQIKAKEKRGSNKHARYSAILKISISFIYGTIKLKKNLITQKKVFVRVKLPPDDVVVSGLDTTGVVGSGVGGIVVDKEGVVSPSV